MDALLNKGFIAKTLIIAAVYFTASVYIMNFRLTAETAIGNYSLNYKLSLLLDLLEGAWTSMTHATVFVLAANSFLAGGILVLSMKKISFLKNAGKLRLMAGGSSILVLAGSGCAACGLPVLSILGLSSAVFYLPFRGDELPYIVLLLLAISFYFLAKSFSKLSACPLPENGPPRPR